MKPDDILSDLNTGIAEYFLSRLRSGRRLPTAELGKIVTFLRNKGVRVEKSKRAR